jgi:hypothetical protein
VFRVGDGDSYLLSCRCRVQGWCLGLCQYSQRELIAARSLTQSRAISTSALPLFSSADMSVCWVWWQFQVLACGPCLVSLVWVVGAVSEGGGSCCFCTASESLYRAFRRVCGTRSPQLWMSDHFMMYMLVVLLLQLCSSSPGKEVGYSCYRAVATA